MAANQSYGAVSAGSTKRKVGLGLVLAALFATAAVLGRARKAFVSSPAFSSGAADCGDCARPRLRNSHRRARRRGVT